jgi:hypothetical protein
MEVSVYTVSYDLDKFSFRGLISVFGGRNIFNKVEWREKIVARRFEVP